MPHRKSAKSPSPAKKAARGGRAPAAKETTGKKKQKRLAAKERSNSNASSKMTLCTAPAVASRAQIRERRPGRPPSGKRFMARALPGKLRSAARRSLDPCDNSNDSGLGFDHHMDPQHAISMNDRLIWSGERAEAKRPRLDIKLENEDVNDNYNFPDTIRNCKDNSTTLIRTAPACSVPALSISTNQGGSQGRAVPRCIPLVNRPSPASPVTLTTQLSNSSRYMDISLSIIKQPEQQHRARYQTEGSRGAVKDREGNGFPVVQLAGYHKPATLQVFIGTDIGKVAPHMFYQACRVSGKNSTPCSEKKVDGTIVIELQLDPAKDMLATCDCVGILKERNVDVEHRFPDQLGTRSKKKSTRCRMIFRTTITHDDGAQETLQVCSQPIVCTQPPGIPEICKKSLTSCPASGGLELFVLGKNFLKDTRIYFQQVDDERRIRWEQSVAPDKEFLQQTHFVCVIPPYARPDINEPVTVRLYVISSGKTSEPHQFVYTPVNGAMPSVRVDQQAPSPFLSKMLWSNVSKQEQDMGMMPPPGTNLVPLASRRSSTSVAATSSDVHSPPVRVLKQELIDDSSQSSIIDPLELPPQERFRHLSESSLDVHQGDSNMSMMNENSMDLLRHGGGGGMEMMSDSSNLSGGVNENSVDVMVRRGSMGSRGGVVGVYEGSMDVNVGNSNLSAITEESTMMHCAGNPMTRPPMMSMEEIKGIDLRMKMPMATVADLVNTTAPSLATLHRFGVTEASSVPLPAQSAQSVENYLTTLETINKSPLALSSQNMTEKLAQMINNEQNSLYAHQKLLNGQVQTLLPPTTPQQNGEIISKMEAAAAATTNPSTTSDATLPAEKLDALVNSAVETHMGGSPPHSPPKDALKPAPPEIIITSQDVMLNSQPPLMVPPMITTANQAEVVVAPPNSSPSIPPDVILNTQISPSIMCRNAEESLLPPAMDSNLIAMQQSSPVGSLLAPAAAPNPALHSSLPNLVASTEAEKAILFKATVDLLQTQKKISELGKMSPNENSMDKVHIMGDFLGAAGGNFVQQGAPVIPVPVKEMVATVAPPAAQAQDKKHDDRMIPSAFATMSESDLINIINPSCFDQGNNFQ